MKTLSVFWGFALATVVGWVLDRAGLLFQVLGMMWGFATILILFLVWYSLAGGLQEWFRETFFPNGFSRNPQKNDQPFENELLAVLVSDLHIDTWEPSAGNHRQVAFNKFVDALCNHPTLEHLIINGDIIDIPLHSKTQKDPTTLEWDMRLPHPAPKVGFKLTEHHKTIEKLFTLKRTDGNPIKTSYVTGNHDIGLQSVRFLWPKSTWSNLQLMWSPALQLTFTNQNPITKDPSTRKIHIEHGHFIDPFLWVYFRTALGELLRRRDSSVTIGKIPVQRDDVEPDKRTEFDVGDSASIKVYGNWLNRLVMRQFRHGARRIFAARCSNWLPVLMKGQLLTAVKILFRREFTDDVRAVIIGHTHSPDRCFFNKRRVYFNSGTWTEDRQFQTYLLIYKNGWITGPHQWDPGKSLKLEP